MSKDLRKPDFLCIGAQKAGTTWLNKNLKKHPQIWMPPLKEVHYFDNLFIQKKQYEKTILKKRLEDLSEKILNKINGDQITYEELKKLANITLVDQIDDNWYLSLFEDAPRNSVMGEITPAYSALPEKSVAYMANLLPSTKLIFLIRNPIKRAWSASIMTKRKELAQNKVIDLTTWIKTVNSPTVSLRSDQQRTIELYEKYFSEEKILYLVYDDICNNPLAVLEKLCNFLEINYNEKHFNKTVKRHFNVNPQVLMPAEIKAILTDKYQEQENWLKERFNLNTLDL